MPPTVVAVAVGALIGVALLGAAFDRRSLAIVVTAAVIPDLDALFALVGPGAPNATFHSVLVPIAAATILYYDTSCRKTSWLSAHYGPYGVRVAWVAIAAYCVAGIGLDAFSTEGVALLYPLSDRYFAIIGRFIVSTQDGIIQTYVTVGDGWLEVATPGTVDTHTIESPLTSENGERRGRIVETGWQAVVVSTAVVTVCTKYLFADQYEIETRRS